jgi:capsular polysaccharide biosynthesis protein
MNDAGTIMTRSTSRKKRSKLAMILFLPIFPIVFIAIWSLYWIGQSWNQNTKQLLNQAGKTSAKPDGVELIVIPQEEQILAN